MMSTAFDHLHQIDLDSFIKFKRVPFDDAPSACQMLDDPKYGSTAVVLIHGH